MSKCIFCQIKDKEVSSKMEYEDDDVMVFWSIEPLTPVHLLIVPKKHIESVDGVEEEDIELMGKLFLTAKKVAKEKGLKDGYKLIVNTGKDAGQTVFHVHMHLLSGKKMGEG